MARSEKQIVEINGVKLEVDTREARKIESYKVSDPVRLLTKTYSGYDVKHGVIVDFAMFEKLPTIEILAIDVGDYASGGLKFYTYNAETKDTEIAPLGHMDALFQRDNILERMDRDIEKLETELRTTQAKRALFLEKFGKFFVENQKAEA